MGFCRRSLETASLYPPVADTARWLQRGGYSEVVSGKCPGFHATTGLEIG